MAVSYPAGIPIKDIRTKFVTFFRGEKSQNLARHIALVHSKLDELLADEDLVESRRQEHMVKFPIRPQTVLCDNFWSITTSD